MSERDLFFPTSPPSANYTRGAGYHIIYHYQKVATECSFPFLLRRPSIYPEPSRKVSLPLRPLRL